MDPHEAAEQIGTHYLKNLLHDSRQTWDQIKQNIRSSGITIIDRAPLVLSRNRRGPNPPPIVNEIHIPQSDPRSDDYRQLDHLSRLSPDEATEKLGTGYFSELIVTLGGASELYTKEERWEEVRDNVRVSHGIAGSGCGYTLFHALAYNGRLEGVRQLLELGYDVDATDRELWTGLHYAAFSGNDNRAAMIRLLVEAGADIHKQHKGEGYTVLHYISLGGDIAAARFLLDQGADVNHNGKSISGQNTSTHTPLHFAAHSGTSDMIHLLLNRGADINAKTTCKWTPLHMAASCGRDAIVKLLLKRGADRRALTGDGKTAGDLARNREYTEGRVLRLDYLF